LERIRVLIADDHPVFRGGLRTLLSSLGEAEVVGEASTGAEAVTAAEALQPDVVVMDLHMRELNGIEATRQIVAQSPHIGVLVLTMFEDDDSVFAAMRAGAKGTCSRAPTRTTSCARSPPSAAARRSSGPTSPSA
jgi:DNA-binding NarL/FixJ family response regulator